MDNELTGLFTDSAARRLAQYMDRIRACVEKISEKQVWVRGSYKENAIGNLMLHLAGNVRQWILSGVGGAPDTRERDSEFAAAGEIPKEQMVAALQAAVDEAAAVIRAQTPLELAGQVSIQGYQISKLEAIFHVVEHFALHAGQIMFATKILTHEDLGFYKHLGSIAAHSGKTP